MVRRTYKPVVVNDYHGNESVFGNDDAERIQFIIRCVNHDGGLPARIKIMHFHFLDKGDDYNYWL